MRKLMSLIRAIRSKVKMARYDDFTIAGHFRDQGARVGTGCRLLIRSLGSEPWLVRIGNHVTISFNVTILTHDGSAWIFTDEIPSLQRFGPVEIGDNCFIGAGAIVMPGVRIGRDSVVGAGAVVTKDVEPGTVVAGVPARFRCRTDELKSRLIAAWEQQRPPGYLSDLDAGGPHPPRHIHDRKMQSMPELRRHLEQLFWGDRTG